MFLGISKLVWVNFCKNVDEVNIVYFFFVLQRKSKPLLQSSFRVLTPCLAGGTLFGCL